ncbi:MAG: hypothetical protein P8176_15200 [Gammaproteobacteria bacterium]
MTDKEFAPSLIDLAGNVVLDKYKKRFQKICDLRRMMVPVRELVTGLVSMR